MRERIKCVSTNLSARRWINSLSQKTDALSIDQTLHACSQKLSSLLSSVNATWSVGIHCQTHTLVHMPTNVNQYLHSITVLV